MGLAVTPILFYRFPRLPRSKDGLKCKPKISVIIPTRNEEKNLPLLLESLQVQSLKPREIICADDDSSDGTVAAAKSFGAKVITLRGKPEGWLGKTWACYNGADAATGDLLLFLDADVRLGHSGLSKLAQAYSDFGCTISVQPYHTTERAYEQFSMLFNLIQIAANGTSLPKPSGVGLYGPVIMISRFDYEKIGGHSAVKCCITEDMALGHRLKAESMPYRLFTGDEDISFRMYGGGIKSLLQGWVKNIASGAVDTPAPIFWMVFFWIASVISVPLHLLLFALNGGLLWLPYLLLYIAWVVVLSFLGTKAGRFKTLAYIFFPIPAAVLLGVFIVSMFKKAFGFKVIWKGRAIEAEKRTCR